MTTIDEMLHVRSPGSYFTDEDRYEIVSAILDAAFTGNGLIARKIEPADGYPRGEKVSYKRVDPGKYRVQEQE